MAYIKLNCDLLDTLDMMDERAAARLIKAALAYKRDGVAREVPESEKLLLSMFLTMLSADEEKAKEISDIRRECGKKGGRPKSKKQMVLASSDDEDEESKKSKKANAFDTSSSSLPPSSPSSPSDPSPCTPNPVSPITPYNPPLSTTTATGAPSGGGEETDDGRTRDTVVGYAVDNLLTLSPTNLEELVSFKADLPDDVICHAVDVALAQGKRNWAYVRAILNRYVTEGLKTLGEIKAQEDRHTAQATRSGSAVNPTNNPALNYQRSEVRDSDLDGLFINLDDVWSSYNGQEGARR